MNTILDLNVAANISYNQQSAYVIAFGNNAGNYSANTYINGVYTIQKQVPLNTFSNAVRDLTMVFTSNTANAVQMSYIGSDANITILPASATQHVSRGIRSISQYNDFYANLVVTDNAVSNSYTIINSIDDSLGNTRTYTATINRLTPTLSVSGPSLFDEYFQSPVNVCTVLNGGAALSTPVTLTMTLTGNGINAGTLSNSVVSANTVTLTDTVANINILVNNNTLTFTPEANLASNLANAITATVTVGNVVTDTEYIDLQLAVLNPYYSFGNGVYAQNTRYEFDDLVRDLDPTATNFFISLQQTSGNTGQWVINDTAVGYSNTAFTLSNTKANINAQKIEWQPAIDATSNVVIIYNQIKTNGAGNTVQAANVAGTYINTSTQPGIINMIGRNYVGNTTSVIFTTSTPEIDNGPDYGQSYTIGLSSALGKFGNSVANAISANSYSFTGNMTQVNSEFVNMRFIPNAQTSNTGTFQYTQARDGVSQISSNVVLTGQAGVPVAGALLNFTANGTFTVTPEQSLYGSFQVLTVGGGGSGARGGFTTGPTKLIGGGGGAGGFRVEAVTQSNQTNTWTFLSSNAETSGVNANTTSFNFTDTYNVVVGAGATTPGTTNANGVAGGASYISLGNSQYFYSAGGQGGFAVTGNGGGIATQGGGIGNTWTPVPTYALPPIDIVGGGGGGGGGGGSNVVIYSGPSTGPASVTTRLGGEPYYSNITGVSVPYAGGGAGGHPNPSAGRYASSGRGAGNTSTPNSDAVWLGGGGGGQGSGSSSPGSGPGQPGNSAPGTVIVKIF